MRITHIQYKRPPTPAPTQFGEYQLKRPRESPLSRAASSGRLRSQVGAGIGSQTVWWWGPFTVGPHMLGGMWMLTKVASVHGLKNPDNPQPACASLSKGCSAESWAAMSSSRWVEGLALYKDLSIKGGDPASLSLLTMMSFSRATKSLGCQIKCFFLKVSLLI